MGMSVDGDGDLGAVVWGVSSASLLHSLPTTSSSPSPSPPSTSDSRGPSAEESSPFASIKEESQTPLPFNIFQESRLNFGSSLGFGFPPPPSFGGDDGLSSLTQPSTAASTPKSVRKSDPLQKQSHPKQISRRRKLQQKRIVYVPASGDGRPSGETLPSDMWAWRKYGQKPIKGSPYPRGYYRCSSSKGCSARKQVERSQVDPSMLIITYTSDHNHIWPAHRNSLAGTTRPKSSAPKIGTNAGISDPPHRLSGDDADNPSLEEKAGFMLENCSGNMDPVPKSGSREEELFLEFDELPEFSSVLKETSLDERSEGEGGNVEVDPYNLFCWSAGELPTF